MKTNKDDGEVVKRASPPSPKRKDFIFAFLIGGFICSLGQLISVGYEMSALDSTSAKIATSVTLVFLAVLFTAFGIFDKIAKVAGAGTLVPITGFANAVASPAIEYKNEGQVLGIGAKMFTIAGPVIVYGTCAGAIYGLILWIISRFGGM